MINGSGWWRDESSNESEKSNTRLTKTKMLFILFAFWDLVSHVRNNLVTKAVGDGNESAVGDGKKNQILTNASSLLQHWYRVGIRRQGRFKQQWQELAISWPPVTRDHCFVKLEVYCRIEVALQQGCSDDMKSQRRQMASCELLEWSHCPADCCVISLFWRAMGVDMVAVTSIKFEAIKGMTSTSW